MVSISACRAEDLCSVPGGGVSSSVLMRRNDISCAISGMYSVCGSEKAMQIGSVYLYTTMRNVDVLGIVPRAFRMRSGCDTTTP